MSSTTTRRPRAAAAAGARKSPLRTATLALPPDPSPGLSGADMLLASGRGPGDLMSAPELRRLQISEFAVWLRTRTNRNRRPFQEATVVAYCDAARSLDRWMTEQDVDGDFTVCDTALLNRFFTGWVTAHGQTGLNTRQRNLRHLFTWLEEAYGHPHPYTAGLHRYAPLKKRPSTLAQEFIADLLEITGGGRARGFEDARDHAMIRMLTEGVRRMELIQLELPDLSADLIARPFVRVVPLKSARAFTEGRIVPLTAATPGPWPPTCGPAAPTVSRRRPRCCGWAPATAAR